MSEWIKSFVNIGDHPKLHRFTAFCAVRKIEAIGHLHCLWWFTLRYAWRDGNLEKFGDVAIARGSMFEGDPKVFVEALQSSGFLDGYLVHDWSEYAGKLIGDRLYNETKRRKTPLNVVKRPKRREEKSSIYKHFVAPTPQEVKDYATSKGFEIDGEKFCSHYGASNWFRGKTKITNWKLCAQTWKKESIKKIEPIIL